ncbi:MAG: PcsB-like coiled-coil domain-containing protein, partial [Gaiellaceae bacterium]
MRFPLLWAAATTALAAAFVATPLDAAPLGRGPSPALKAKQAQAEAVLAQVDALDRRFDRTDENWNLARLQLRSAEANLNSNERALRRARAAQKRVEAQVAQRLVVLYETDDPSTIDVIAGSATLGDVIDRVQAKESITSSDARLARSAEAKRRRLARAEETLLASEQERSGALQQLARQRAQIGDFLARRRTLLASVQSEVASIRAREQREQARLAAQARRRLEAEQAAAAHRAALARQAELRRRRAAEDERASPPRAP